MASALETARTRLDLYLQREAQILSAGQDTTIADRRRRDADLDVVQKAIRDLQIEIAALETSESGGSRFVQVVPL